MLPRDSAIRASASAVFKVSIQLEVKDIVAACAKGTAPVMDGSCQSLMRHLGHTLPQWLSLSLHIFTAAALAALSNCCSSGSSAAR